MGPVHFIPVTDPIERLNKEVKRRADVVGIFPNEKSIRAAASLAFSRPARPPSRHWWP